MEKRKIDFSKYADMHEEKVIKGKDGNEIIVRDHIPFADKEIMARDMITYTTVIHDDSCVYTSVELEKYKMFAIAKYYTDIDTEDADINDVADYMVNNGLIEEVSSVVNSDFSCVMNMYWLLYDALVETYRDDTSLSKAIRTSFGFLFNGEDITESLAKAEAMKDTVIEAVGALRKVEKEREENIDNGTLRVDGNVINFAKKE